MRYKVIYTCGDSHTAGGELADDLVWPDQHPGFFSHADVGNRDVAEIARWRARRHENLNRGDPINATAWQELEHQYAWPAVIGSITGVETRNGARIGSSMEWISRQVIDDVASLLEHTDPARLLVLVQPSTHLRIQLHDPAQGGWISLQIAQENGIDQHVQRWLRLHETEESLITRWMLAVIGMVSYLQVCGIRCLLIDSGRSSLHSIFSNAAMTRDISKAFHKVTDSLWLPHRMSDSATRVERPYCPDLHFTREVHRAFAEDIVGNLS